MVGEGGPLIEAEGLVKRYGKTEALAGVDLAVARGELFGLIGPDGAGKSSLMQIVAGVLAFDAGRVAVFGETIDSERAAERIKGRLGFMPQGLGQNLYPELSVEENVDFFAAIRGVSGKTLAGRKADFLAMTRLEDAVDRPMKHLSGGMKQKLGLVCTLIHQPELVILDEPTTGVDPLSRRDFWAILARLLDEREITALVSTAYMDEAERFARLAMVHKGRVLDRGAPRDIAERAGGEVLECSLSEAGGAANSLRERFARVQELGGRVRVYAEDDDQEDGARRAVAEAAGVEPEEVEASRPTLEDVFVARLVDKDASSGSGSRPEVGDSWASGGGAALSAEALVKRFGDFTAVDEVSLSVAAGEIFGLLGANGAGKTTLLKMLLGIIAPTSGRAELLGETLRGRRARRLKSRLGYMSQIFSLYEDLTVRENIRLYAGIYGLTRAFAREREAWVLETAGLADQAGARAKGLPVGRRQRLALGCALLHKPEIVVLDEPTSGVDPVGRQRFWEVLTELAGQAGVAVAVTTHYMAEAEHCDRLALMHRGRIAARGSPRELKQEVRERAGEVVEVAVERPAEAVRVLQEAGFEGAGLYGRAVRFLSPEPGRAGDEAREALSRAGIEAGEAGVRPISMDEVFALSMGALGGQGEAAR